MLDVTELFDLDPHGAHLNHGSFGATPSPVLVAQDQLRRRIERNPHRFFSEEYQDALAVARGQITAFVDAVASEVVLLRNVTEGVNATIASLPLGAGDEVLMTSHEYDSNLRAWQRRCDAVGATLITAELFDASGSPHDIFADHLSDRTRVVFLSHITSSTALQLDLKSLIPEARRGNAIVVIDGAHGPGQVDLNLTALGADLYVGSLHKWAMFPRGASFLAARPSLHQIMVPQLVSWYYASPDLAHRFSWQGTFDPSPWLVSESVLAFHAWANSEALFNRAHQLSLMAEARLLDLPGVVPVGGRENRPRYMFSVSVPVDHLALRQRLRQANVWAWTGQFGGRTILRVSTSVYNKERDIDRLGEEVARIIAAEAGGA